VEDSHEPEHRDRLGRDETSEAILDAAEELFADRGYTAVTVREIAAAAGVSHALVHRYLGSKEALYRAMLQRRENLILDAAPAEEDLVVATRLMLRAAVAESRYVKLLVHSALHGLPYERTMGRFAATERLIELAQATASAEGDDRGPDAMDPRFVIASFVAMLLGWSAARDWLRRAAGLQDLGDEELVGLFERLVVDVERLYFPSLKDVDA
jgi:AcrR family transcriptional regulator